MLKRFIIAAALIVFAAAPAVLRSQQAAVSVCKDSTTTTATGAGTCSSHGGVDKNATAAKHSKTGVQKAEASTVTAANNTGKAVSKGAADAVKATGSAAATVGKTASSAAEDAGKAAKGAANETVGDKTNATAAHATAKCKDGTYSHATQHAGACAKHGGVSSWMDGKTS